MSQTEENAVAVAILRAYARGEINQWEGESYFDLDRLEGDLDLYRRAEAFRDDDWHRIAQYDEAALAQRLEGWREEGRALNRREGAIAADFLAGVGGDPAALDRLRAPEAEGGHGLAYLARLADGADKMTVEGLSDPKRIWVELSWLATQGWDDDSLVQDLRRRATDIRNGEIGAEKLRDPDICRVAETFSLSDWHRIANSSLEDLTAQLPALRAQGYALLVQDRDPDRKVARDLRALARGEIRNPYGRAGDIRGAPALSADPALRRFVGDVFAADFAADLDRLASADMADIIARLPGWRERGRALLDQDFALVTDYTAARAGDEAARDRLRASVAEGGHGEPDLAMASAWDHAEDLSGMTLAEAADALECYAQALAEDRMEYDLGDDEMDDEMDDEVRDYEEGDEPGRYYR